MKSSRIGGQAVLEGIMMRNGSRYAVAVRKPDKEIAVVEETYRGLFGDSKVTKLPFVRGIFNFIDSMVLGVKSINISADYFAEMEEEEQSQAEPAKQSFIEKHFTEDQINGVITAVTMAVAFLLAMVIFMMLPVWIASFFKRFTDSYVFTALIEGVLRVVIFIAYIVVIGQMKDIKRTYMYHGAEHKCINCIESGLPLNVENVAKSSKVHKRCGTSFMLFVMLISVFFFMFIRVDNIGMRMLSRVLLIPVIAGISYEFIRLAGSSDNPVVCAVSKPGLWMQGLTTKEPDLDMIEVAIRAVDRVFDWRAYQAEVFGDTEEQAVKHDTVKRDAAKHDTVKHDAAKHDTVKHDAARRENVKHDAATRDTEKQAAGRDTEEQAASRNTVRRDAAKHDAIRRNADNRKKKQRIPSEIVDDDDDADSFSAGRLWEDLEDDGSDDLLARIDAVELTVGKEDSQKDNYWDIFLGDKEEDDASEATQRRGKHDIS